MASAKSTKQPPAKAAAPQPAGPARPEPKVLRIGVIQGGKIIEERLVRKRENVTIGQSPKNTFIIPASSLPKTFTLFELTGDKFFLNFSEGMDGRVSVGSDVLDFAALHNQGKVMRKGELYQLPLDERSRGKVILGEVTLLFQFVVPPPIQPKPQLPASVRQGWIRGMDWVFASIFLVSFLFHTGFVIYLASADFPTQVAWDDIPDTFAEALAEPPKPLEKKVEKKEDKGEDKKAEESKEEAKEAPKAAQAAPKPKKAISAEEAARLAAQRRARLADQVARLGALSIIGAKKDGSGGVADLLKGGGTGDVEAAFDKIGGVGISGAGAGGALGGKGASGSGRLQSIGQLGTRGAGAVGGVGDKGPEKKVRAIARASTPSIDGKIDASIVAKEIRRRMKSIQACYERELKRNPKLGGKIGLRITIGTVGKVTNASIESDTVNDPTVNACVKTTVLRWRFPAPDGGSADVVIPIVLQSSN